MNLAGLQTGRITRALASLPPNAEGRAGRSSAMIDDDSREDVPRSIAPTALAAPAEIKVGVTMADPAVALSDDAPHLLLVDDDRRIRDLLSRFLSSEGYRVTTAKSAPEARAKLGGLHFDLLILDVMMPGETGFELARSIRKTSNVPILMLTARHESESRIEGLSIGADDYVAKPFEPRELILRIAGILRRVAPVPVKQAESVKFGPYVFHIERGELRNADEVMRLTDRERDILRILAAAPGDTVPARGSRGCRRRRQRARR